MNDGNVVSLSKLLGHSSLDIAQNYINLLISDVAKQVDEFNVLDKLYGRMHISMKDYFDTSRSRLSTAISCIFIFANSVREAFTNKRI